MSEKEESALAELARIAYVARNEGSADEPDLEREYARLSGKEKMAWRRVAARVLEEAGK